MYKTFAALAVQKTIKITSAVKKRTSRPQLACAPLPGNKLRSLSWNNLETGIIL